MTGYAGVENKAFNAMQRIVLATHNVGKVREIANALSGAGFEVVSMKDLDLPAPDETGTSFEANAELKAMAAAAGSGLWALADDSGLEVDFLDGKPGVETAAYGGWEKLTEVMTHVPEQARGARFVCVLALVRMGLPTIFFKGVCEGAIATQAKGDGGFGYDPVFIPSGHSLTFAEMTKVQKSAISHRGQAVAQLTAWAAAEKAAF